MFPSTASGIVQGVYPEVEAGEPLLHRSIFEAVRSRVSVDSPIVRLLLENRRMNDVLTSFAAEPLYGRDYRCFDASREFDLGAGVRGRVLRAEQSLR